MRRNGNSLFSGDFSSVSRPARVLVAETVKRGEFMFMQWMRTVRAKQDVRVAVCISPALLVLVAGCAVKPLPVPDTRALTPPVSPMAAVARISEATKQHGWRDHLQITRGTGQNLSCRYSDTADPKVIDVSKGAVNWYDVSVAVQCDGAQSFVFKGGGSKYDPTARTAALSFASLWSALALVPVDARQAFEAQAVEYRGLAEKPSLPESAREYKVRAEVAVREGRLLDAVEAYDRGLQIAPTWPQGHFNVALLLGELKTYGLATEEMQRYLALVPDAANARQAQDKIYEWRGKLEQPLPR